MCTIFTPKYLKDKRLNMAIFTDDKTFCSQFYLLLMTSQQMRKRYSPPHINMLYSKHV